MARRTYRLTMLLVLVGATLLVSGCKVNVGCRVVSFLEPGTPEAYYVDDSACVTATTPPPVIPEVPIAILLPLMGIAMVGTVMVVRSRRTRALV